MRIRAITRRQRARVSRAQLLAAGVDANAIKRRLCTGRLVTHHRGVYGLPQTEEFPLSTEAAALLACGERAALSHHSAAVLWRLRPGAARPVQGDRQRDARLLTEKGILVLRLTDAMIDERPFEVIGLLARAIGQQEAQRRARREPIVLP